MLLPLFDLVTFFDVLDELDLKADLPAAVFTLLVDAAAFGLVTPAFFSTTVESFLAKVFGRGADSP